MLIHVSVPKLETFHWRHVCWRNVLCVKCFIYNGRWQFL